MSGFKTFNALSLCMTACVTAIMATASAIALCGDEDQTESPTSFAQQAEPIATKLKQCRTVKYEQKDAFLACQELWAEKRRQFLGQKSRPSLRSEGGISGIGSSSALLLKDESRFPFAYPTMPAQSE